MTNQVWVKANGDRVWISQMSDLHLLNVKRMVERNNAQSKYPQYYRICREIESRNLARKLR